MKRLSITYYTDVLNEDGAVIKRKITLNDNIVSDVIVDAQQGEANHPINAEYTPDTSLVTALVTPVGISTADAEYLESQFADTKLSYRRKGVSKVFELYAENSGNLIVIR